MLLRPAQLGQPRGDGAGPGPASPASTRASTRSGATGKAPGSATPSRSVWSHTAPRCSTAPGASFSSSATRPSARFASSQSQRTPVGVHPVEGRATPSAARPPGLRGPRPAAPGSARTSASAAAGCRRRHPSRRAGRCASSAVADRGAPARTGAAAPGRTTTARPRSSASVRSEVSSSRAGVDLPAPDQALAGDPLRPLRHRDALARGGRGRPPTGRRPGGRASARVQARAVRAWRCGVGPRRRAATASAARSLGSGDLRHPDDGLVLGQLRPAPAPAGRRSSPASASAASR